MNSSNNIESYRGSTLYELNHQSSNNLVLARLELDDDADPEEIGQYQNKFIAGLTRAVEEDFPVFGDITRHNLSEVIDLAGSIDWTDSDQLQQLTDLCGELRNPFEG